MNLVEVLNSKNTLVKELFSNGLNKEVYIEDIVLSSMHNSAKITICLKEKPTAVPIKWGVWGLDFNTIKLVFECNPNSLIIDNWQKRHYSTLRIKRNNNQLSCCQRGKDWMIEIICCNKIEFHNIKVERGIDKQKEENK